MKKTILFAVPLSIVLASCSSGNAGEGTTYNEQLSCYITLMGVNAANRETGPELEGPTTALLLMKTVEMEQPDKAQQVREDLHAASSKIRDIMAMDTASPEFAALQTEAEACSEKFKK